MDIEIEEVRLNYLTAEKRVEITVRTMDGLIIVFPSAQVETHEAPSGSKTKTTLYAYAQKVETNPSPRVYTLIVVDEEDGPSRHSLQEFPMS